MEDQTNLLLSAILLELREMNKKLDNIAGTGIYSMDDVCSALTDISLNCNSSDVCGKLDEISGNGVWTIKDICDKLRDIDINTFL